jgi:hypothetical protein
MMISLLKGSSESLLCSLLSSMPCMQFFFKSCPHDRFVLNYDLLTKLYIISLARSYSFSEKSLCTGQVQLRTSSDKYNLLGI